VSLWTVLSVLAYSIQASTLSESASVPRLAMLCELYGHSPHNEVRCGGFALADTSKKSVLREADLLLSLLLGHLLEETKYLPVI